MDELGDADEKVCPLLGGSFYNFLAFSPVNGSRNSFRLSWPFAHLAVGYKSISGFLHTPCDTQKISFMSRTPYNSHSIASKYGADNTLSFVSEVYNSPIYNLNLCICLRGLN